MPDRPWGGMRHGKGITDAWLADQLQPHGIAPRTMRIGSMQAKGYFEEDFQEAFQRYMSRSEIEALRARLGQRSEDGGLRADVSGQRSAGEEKKPDANDQRPEIEGRKKDETRETPGSEAAAA